MDNDVSREKIISVIVNLICIIYAGIMLEFLAKLVQLHINIANSII